MNINHFGPFSSDVWGTVSDWIYIIVTATTLYFIYRTFRSQLEVQRMQLKITNIENERYRHETLPVFEAEIMDEQPTQPSEPSQMLVCIGIALKKYACKNVKLTVASHMAEKLEWTHLVGNFKYVTAGSANLIDVLITKQEHSHKWMFPIELIFHFEDMVGNSYEQNIHCMWRGSGKHQVLNFMPVPMIYKN